jgi:hypothetical protein
MTEKHRDDAVGYGRPPKHSRFRPGQSGNPSGRRRGTEGHRRLLEEALEQPITIHEDGRTFTIRHSEAMYRSLVARAIQGDMRAAALIIRLADRLGLSNPADNDDKTIIVRVLPFGDREP